MNDRILNNFCKSINIANVNNSNVINDIIYKNSSNTAAIFLLLRNESLKSTHLTNILNSLSEHMLFDLFMSYNVDYDANSKFIESALNSSNAYIDKYIIRLLIDGNCNDKLIKRFYKYYNVKSILYSKEALIEYLVNNKPEVMLDYFYCISEDKVDDNLFEHIVSANIDRTFINLCKNKLLSQKQFQALLDKIGLSGILHDGGCGGSIIGSFYWCCYHLIENPLLPKGYIQILLDAYIYKNDNSYISSLSRNPSLSEEQINILLSLNNLNINNSLSRNPSLSKKQVDILLDKNDYYTMIPLAKNPLLSNKKIDDLIDKNDYNINCCLAQNPRLSSKQMDKIMINMYYSHLSKNPSLPKEKALKLIRYRPVALRNFLNKNK